MISRHDGGFYRVVMRDSLDRLNSILDYPLLSSDRIVDDDLVTLDVRSIKRSGGIHDHPKIPEIPNPLSSFNNGGLDLRRTTRARIKPIDALGSAKLLCDS